MPVDVPECNYRVMILEANLGPQKPVVWEAGSRG